MTGRTQLCVGGVAIAVDAPAAVDSALRLRFGPFISTGSGIADDVRLEVATAGEGFEPDFHLDEPAIRLAAGAGGQVQLDGAARGAYDPAARRGFLDGARHLGELDALVRLSLSLALPGRGALLAHGAAVATGEGALVLVGASGAGKSTAAAALGGSLSDELVVLRPDEGGLFVEGTPYWRGRPGRRRLEALVVLERGGGPPERAPLAGGAAMRAFLPNVVRYLARSPVDGALFALAGRLCERAAMLRLRCPEGPAFVPFLERALAVAA
jgi:hypothetical protein